jgi:hypothetical protein
MTNKPNDFNFDEDPFGDGDNDPFGSSPRQNDFSFDDLGDDSSNFIFDDDDDVNALPPGLGDDVGGDMPVLVEEGGGGTSRTFIALAVLMILLFLGGLALVVVLLLRPTGPTDIELTATQIVQLNETVSAQLAQTQTQALIFQGQTQTVEAFTDTPTPTETPTVATRPPTRTPTATLDPTELAGTAQAEALALTATALAQPTGDLVTRPPTVTPTSAQPEIGLGEFFATQIAFATAQGQAQQNMLATMAAGGDDAMIAMQATMAGMATMEGDAATAIAEVDLGLGNFAQTAAPIATQLAQGTLDAPSTQAVINQIVGEATFAAQATQAAMDIMMQAMTPEMTEEAPGTMVAVVPAVIATVAAQGTQDARESAQFLATAEGQATQIALATRAALVEQALSGQVIAQLPTNTPALSGINQTATAIAEAFQAATRDVLPTLEPGVVATTGFPTLIPTPQILPDTGLFDEASGGLGYVGVGMMVVGLLGVAAIARYLRRKE